MEQDGEVVAFASTSIYRLRDYYDGIAEVSVYVARKFRRCGAGRVALDELIKQAKAKGFWIPEKSTESSTACGAT